MSKTRAEVTVDFDHHRPARVLNPDLVYSELRHECPVAWSEAHGGFWLATRFEDVERVTRTHQFFSTREGITLPPPPYGQSALIDFDPPKHTAYRRALNHLLSKDAVQEKLKPRIAYWTDIFIDRVIDAGKCDLVYDLAVAIPTAVTMEWLGWSNQSDWWKFGKAWHDLMGRPLGDPGFNHASEVIAGFDVSIAEELARRRTAPCGDALSHVANLEIDGQRMAEDEAVSLIRLLVGAGVDTTTSLIGSALVHLHYFPEHRRRLAQEPELWVTATEEFLRRYSPIRTVMRTCVQETELGGYPVEPGEHVLAGISSANLDGDAFPHPLRLDLERKPNRHVSFGAGVHMCLGMHLARAEFEVVVRRVIERMPDYRVTEDALIEYSRQSSVAGWMTAPATFTPGPKIAPDDRAAAGFSLAY